MTSNEQLVDISMGCTRIQKKFGWFASKCTIEFDELRRDGFGNIVDLRWYCKSNLELRWFRRW